MLIAKSRYSFTSTGPDRVSILSDKTIPGLARERGWPFVALADERTMAGTLEFLAAARDVIPAAAGIQVSGLAHRGGTLSLILVALQQSGLQRLLAASGALQTAGTLDDVAAALRQDAPDGKPDILAAIAVPKNGYLGDAREVASLLLSLGLGPIAADIRPGGAETGFLWADTEASLDFAADAEVPAMIVQTAYSKHAINEDAVSTLNALSTIRASPQGTREVKDPERPARHAMPHYTPAEHEDAATTAIIARIAPTRLDNPPTLPERLGLEDGEDAMETLSRMARDGLDTMLDNGMIQDEQTARSRLDFELSVIEQKGFANYFLIIQDAIAYARSRNIPVGPGRGSVAGSLVAYTTGITRIDPLRHGLFFERFINPERTSLPDIDTDFCAARRIEVFCYLRERYGADRVAHIATYADSKPRSTIRDAARILGVQGAGTALIGTLEAALPETRAWPPQEVIVETLNRIAAAEGTPTDQARIARMASFSLNMPATTSIHAGGILLSDRPIVDRTPLHAGRDQDGLPISQFSMEIVERSGLTKFDFLSLKTLTVIEAALALIRTRTGRTVDIERIPENDQAVFALISSGKTQTIFQLEDHRGIGSAARDIGISCMADIIALVALYRPGPMKYIPIYAACKKGEREVTYPHDSLTGILRETHGIIVYQEQIMQIAQSFAGYSPGEADILRKAVGKKKPEILAKERSVFVGKAIRNGQKEQDAETIFEFILPFAEYGFNKSHAAAYAKLTWQTAWLRHHYPAEWFSAVAQHASKKMKASDVLKLARSSGTPIVFPDINGPVHDFETENGPDGKPLIRCPLSLIENTKAHALDMIKEARSKGRFCSGAHLLSQIGTRCNATITALIGSGAMDSISEHPPGVARAVFTAMLGSAATLRPDTKADDRQTGLFTAEAPGSRSRDPDPSAMKGNPRYDYRPLGAKDLDDERNALLNNLPTSTQKGSSTATSDWLRKIENLSTIDGARKIATQTPARALAVLTSIHDQKESIAAGRRVIEVAVEDETGQYVFDVAPGVELDPDLVSRSRRSMVRITISAAPKDALLSGRVVVTAISGCPDPIESENRPYPLIHIEHGDAKAMVQAILRESLSAARRFAADGIRRKKLPIPPKPNHALIVTSARDIIPVDIQEPVRYYGIEQVFGAIEGVSRIEF